VKDSRVETNAVGRSGGSVRTLAPSLEILARAGIALLPLACWPNLERAFFTPKLALLLAVDTLLALLFWVKRSQIVAAGTWQVLLWVVAVSVSVLLCSYAGMESLTLALAVAPLFWAVASGLLAAQPLAGAIAAGAAAESAVALLQYLGADPLQLLGWHVETFHSPRMRVYGTLGNPDFVAAWCCAALPISYFATVERARSKRGRAIGWGIVALQLAAILATGSRAALVALAAQAIALIVYRGSGWKKWLAMLPVAALALVLPGSRALDETLRGRLYLARVSLSQVRHLPLTGYGPGSFEPQFAQWQVQWLQEHGTVDARFAGSVDHAHNDYIEFLVEYGPLGLGALLAATWPLAAVRRSTARHASGLPIAAAAGFAGLLASALIDFPLHRPAEWALFWLFAGVIAQIYKADLVTHVQRGDS
jgi:putative inorganic carbon (HCO3(-)) transporter